MKTISKTATKQYALVGDEYSVCNHYGSNDQWIVNVLTTKYVDYIHHNPEITNLQSAIKTLDVLNNTQLGKITLNIGGNEIIDASKKAEIIRSLSIIEIASLTTKTVRKLSKKAIQIIEQESAIKEALKKKLNETIATLETLSFSECKKLQVKISTQEAK